MAFDDLARHMASRAGKKMVAGSADQIVADAESAARRMSRTRDLILGLLLLVGGLVILAGYALTLLDFLDPTPSRLRPGGTERVPLRVWVFLLFAGGGAVIVGTTKLIRGLTGRSK